MIISFVEPFRRQEEEKDVDNKGGMLKNKKTRAVGVGILAAVLFLCVVLPLLMMSDRIFSRFFKVLSMGPKRLVLTLAIRN